MENLISNIRCNREKPKKQVYIPQELQEKILPYLPLKTLIRFKSVCKTWNSLIQSRSFIDSHRLRNQHNYSNQLVYSPYSAKLKFFMHKSVSPSTLDMIKLSPGPKQLRFPMKMIRLSLLPADDFNEEWRPTLRVLGPLSNGIYLVTNLYKDYGNSYTCILTGKVALCNPATHDYKLIGTAFPYNDPTYVQICSDDKKYRVHYGFGTTRDDCRDYKVVVVIAWGLRFSSFLSYVYSLKSGTWRKLDTKFLGLQHYPEIVPELELCPQRFLNGCWHWMAALQTGRCSIMSFDCTHDSFKLVDPPPYHHYIAIDHNCHKSGVLVLNDRLATIFFSLRCTRVHVWMMMEYEVGESWTRIYSAQPNYHGYFTTLVGISPRNDDDYGIGTLFFADSHYTSLISCDCDASGYKSHVLRDISSCILWNTLGISSYIETLEPL